MSNKLIDEDGLVKEKVSYLQVDVTTCAVTVDGEIVESDFIEVILGNGLFKISGSNVTWIPNYKSVVPPTLSTQDIPSLSVASDNSYSSSELNITEDPVPYLEKFNEMKGLHQKLSKMKG